VIQLNFVDGGRSHVVSKSLSPLLDGLIRELRSDVGLVLYQSSGSPGAYVLASIGPTGFELPLPNEPLRVGQALRSWSVSSRKDLTLESIVRPYAVRLATAVVMPWHQDEGRGWVIAGLRDPTVSAPKLDPKVVANLEARFTFVHRNASVRSSKRLRRDLDVAFKRLSTARLHSEKINDTLEAILAITRSLIHTDVAYISMPDDDGTTFRFTNLLNIRTGPFKRLEMGPGAGLGGLAREELRAVRSLNYAEDPRLRQAPVRETLGEGLNSAMCAPLIGTGNELLGLLYTANRSLTPFTESDVNLLNEFASFAALNLETAEAEQHRLSAMRRLEQERLAFELHDSLVRDLMEIGFTAEAGLAVAGDAKLRNHLQAIGKTAETCLERVREEITRMANGREFDPASVGEVLEHLRATRSYRAVNRSFTAGGNARRLLPPRVASALISVGEEAIANAERHSNASRVDVHIDVGDEARLRVIDDGAGVSTEVLEASTSDDSSHLGLRHMRAVTRRLNGSLQISSTETGGCVVECAIPLSGLADQ
jgi:signal transduction histidine kinase